MAKLYTVTLWCVADLDYKLNLYGIQVAYTQSEHVDLVYADIDPSSLNTKIASILALDDSRVDYAQINHDLLRKETKHLESEMDKQPGDIILTQCAA